MRLFSLRERVAQAVEHVRSGFCTVRLSNVGPKRDAGLGIDHRDARGTRRHRFIRARNILFAGFGVGGRCIFPARDEPHVIAVRKPQHDVRFLRRVDNLQSPPFRKLGVSGVQQLCGSRLVIDIDGAGGENFRREPGALVLGVDRHAAEENQQSDSDENTRERLQRTHSLPHGRRPMQPQTDLILLKVYDWQGRPETGPKTRKSADGPAMEGPVRWGSEGEQKKIADIILAGNAGVGGERAFPARNHDAGDTISENGDRSSPHIHELIDGEKKK